MSDIPDFFRIIHEMPVADRRRADPIDERMNPKPDRAFLRRKNGGGKFHALKEAQPSWGFIG